MQDNTNSWSFRSGYGFLLGKLDSNGSDQSKIGCTAHANRTRKQGSFVNRQPDE
jgi:hypothetical protein